MLRKNQWSPEGKELFWVKGVKGINSIVLDINQTCGGNHFLVYTDVKL